MVGLPQFEIEFKKLSSSFIERSNRGVAILIIKDDTDKTFECREYITSEDLEKEKTLYSAENYKRLEDVMHFGVSKLVVIRIDEDSSIETGLEIINKRYETGWVSTVGISADYDKIVTWIKVKSTEGKTFKCITYKLTAAPDHKRVHDFVNETVTFKDDRGKVSGVEYVPSLLAIACVCNVTRGMTYFECKNLIDIEPVANVTQSLNSGKLILIHDQAIIRVGTGINTLTTFTDSNGNFEDMRFIENVEATDMIHDDIKRIYKNKYVGAYKNNLDNQILFLSAVNTFFEELEEIEVLDNKFENIAYINISTQRKAWATINPEAKTWDDTKVKNMSFKRSMFLGANIKVLGSIMDLDLDVIMA